MADITSPRNLNPARRHRSYPASSAAPGNSHPSQHGPPYLGIRYHGPPTIKLVGLQPKSAMTTLG